MPRAPVTAQIEQHIANQQLQVRRLPRAPVRPVSQQVRDAAIGMAFAKRVADGQAIRDKRRDLLVRSDRTMERIKQRKHAEGVRQLLAQNRANWRDINKDWAAYGPELQLTSRGTPGRVLGALPPGTAPALAVLAVGWVGVAYFLYEAYKAPKGRKTSPLVKAGFTWIGTGLVSNAALALAPRTT